MSQKFITPNRIITGSGAIDTLPEQIEYLNSKRPIIVTGKNWARKSGWLEKITDLTKQNNEIEEITTFEGVPSEPTCDVVDRLRDKIKENSCDLIIGLGGGSAIDVAKAAAILTFSDKPTDWHLLNGNLPNRALPIIAIPSTSGTGSEATIATVLSIPDKGIKQSFKSELILPKIAIVDPQLTLSCPKHLTAYAGMDALTQAIESFSSKYAYDLTDALAEKSIKLLYENLPIAYDNGNDINVREKVANGSLLAGIALVNAKLGLVHGLAHPLGGMYHQPHGLLCAILLPTILEFNKPILEENGKYKILANILSDEPTGAIKKLLTKLNIPHNLKALNINIKKEDYPILIERTLVSGSTKANPREVKHDDIKMILDKLT